MRRTGKAKAVIWRWQERFSAEGLPSLWRDKARPSRIPPLASEVAEHVVASTLAGPSQEATTGAAMAEPVGISVCASGGPTACSRTECVGSSSSNDPQFAACR
jgi:hypothetical protein